MTDQATAKAIEDSKARVLPFFHPQKDKPRNESLVLMRVENRGTLNLQIGSMGDHCQPGTSLVLVYESDIPIVEALVERDTDMVEHAMRQYELALAEQVRSDSQAEHISDKTAAEALALIKAGTDAKVNEVYQKTRAITQLSFEQMFQTLAMRSLKPLVAAEVVERGIPEIQRAGTAAEASKLVDAIVAGMTKVNAELVASMGANIGAEIGKALRDALGGGGKSSK